MTDTDTSPEAVERLARMLETDASDQNFMPDELTGLLPDNEYEIATTLRALSAERDAIKAELAEAVGLMQDMRDHGANDCVIDRVLGFLARHQKGAGA